MLGVESPLVCDILPHADETGLMPPGLLDTIDKDPIAAVSEGIFSEEEERTFEELKRKHKSESAQMGSAGEHSSKTKTSQITKESVKIIDGVKTTSKETIIDGKLVSSSQVEEFVGSKAAVGEEAHIEDEGEDEE